MQCQIQNIQFTILPKLLNLTWQVRLLTKTILISFRDFSRPDLPSGEGQPSFDPNLGLSALGV